MTSFVNMSSQLMDELTWDGKLFVTTRNTPAAAVCRQCLIWTQMDTCLQTQKREIVSRLICVEVACWQYLPKHCLANSVGLRFVVIKDILYQWRHKVNENQFYLQVVTCRLFFILVRAVTDFFDISQQVRQPQFIEAAWSHSNFD